MLQKISYHYHSIYAKLIWESKTIFYGYKQSRVYLVQKEMFTKFTWAPKKSLWMMSVNQAHSVNEGNVGWNQC